MDRINELMNNLQSIEYGWIDKDGGRHEKLGSDFASEYRLQLGDECYKNQLGVCWDQVEYEASFLDAANIDNQSYFIYFNDNDRLPSHTFLVAKVDEKIIWIEHAWEKFAGIHEYDSEDELLKDIKTKFIETSEFGNNCNRDNVFIFKYSRPTFKLTCDEFYKHAAVEKQLVEIS